MIKTRVEDGGGRGTQAHIEDNALLVTQFSCPPMVPQKNRVLRRYLTVDGTTSGSNSMLAAGTATAPVDYYVQAHCDCDRYITSVSFVIADDGVSLELFGAEAALANGCQFFYESDSATVMLHGALKTNWDFVRMCGGNPAFGTGTAAFKASKVEGKVDAYVPVFDTKGIMPPYGIKLDAGSNQRLVVRIVDSTTGVDAFDAIAYGFDRFE